MCLCCCFPKFHHAHYHLLSAPHTATLQVLLFPSHFLLTKEVIQESHRFEDQKGLITCPGLQLKVAQSGEVNMSFCSAWVWAAPTFRTLLGLFPQVVGAQPSTCWLIRPWKRGESVQVHKVQLAKLPIFTSTLTNSFLLDKVLFFKVYSCWSIPSLKQLGHPQSQCFWCKLLELCALKLVE